MSRQSILRICICRWIIPFCLCGTFIASAHERDGIPPEAPPPEELALKEKPAWGHRILWYVPNRLLDIVDMARVRARFGEGWAGSIRLGDPMSFYAGSYTSHYVGLPGPRYPERIKKPYGVEELTGLQLSIADATDESLHEPGYGYTEFAVGAQLGYVGLDLGSDPFEWIDMALGLFCLDPRGDDL